MAITRSGFLGLLAGAGVLAAEAGSIAKKSGKKYVSKIPSLPAERLLKGELLIDSYLPILKVNEGEVLHFYHKPGDKVTVGYGTNVESNPDYLSDVPVYFKGKPLTQTAKKNFMATMAQKAPSDLAQYSITQADAKKMAIKGMKDAISALEKVFATTQKPAYFHSLPLCMQALCMDIFYNVGRGGFKKYPKFQAAIRRRDFDTAVRESVVYVNKEKKTTNVKREWMKKRLLSVMRLVRSNATIQSDAMVNLVRQNYEQTTPLSMRLLQRANFDGELSMAIGELTQIRIQRQANSLLAPRQPQKDISLKSKAILHMGGRQ